MDEVEKPIIKEINKKDKKAEAKGDLTNLEGKTGKVKKESSNIKGSAKK